MSLWGKTAIDGAMTSTLPLLAHLADVALTLGTLCCLEIYRSRLSCLFGRQFNDTDAQRFACLAALHDIGKATPGFQNKNTPGSHPTNGHIEPIGGLFIGSNKDRFLGACSFLCGWDDRGGESVFEYLAASFSHHGEPFAKSDFERPTKAGLWPSSSRAPAWQFLHELVDSLKEWFPEAFREGAPPLPMESAGQHLFAGLVMLADWIGSDRRFFHIPRQVAPGNEMAFSRAAATKALATIGLDSVPCRIGITVSPAFDQQFSFHANALQRAVDTLPLSREGGLTIIEAETGCGKTEAALRFFTRLWCEGLVDGLYFANPLRFAATQLYGRVTRFVTNTFGDAPPPTVLAVPGYLRVDGACGTLLPGFEVQWNDDPDRPAAERRSAAEHPKRFLAAPLAVGTIDQALLGTLRVRHAHMRAAALCRSLLVVDEVHASDAYMTRLTLRLLDFFRRTGGMSCSFQPPLAAMSGNNI